MAGTQDLSEAVFRTEKLEETLTEGAMAHPSTQGTTLSLFMNVLTSENVA